MMNQNPHQTTDPEALDLENAKQPDRAHRIHSHELFGGATEILIHHDAADYRLRITSNGKLILTK